MATYFIIWFLLISRLYNLSINQKTELDKMTRVLFDELIIDDVFYCAHDDSDLCNCRKPAPGLFIQAAEKWNIDLENSFVDPNFDLQFFFLLR